jgi:epoxyqueuosine reductase
VIADGRASIESLIKAQALGLGFDLVGITRTGPAETADAFEQWLAAGHAGSMHYLDKHLDVRRDSRRPFDGAVSAIVVGLDYGGSAPAGPVARYARGDDYHEVMWRKLDALQAWIEHHVGHTISARGYVDTGPLLERDLARRAGLGWFGKNTNLINPQLGSFFFIGALLVNLELDADAPFEADRCGSCTRCLDACPTQAFVGSHELDATRCISYLTIELRDEIPVSLREPMSDLLYGCDICQEVCPWNVKFARDATEHAFRPRAVVDGKDGRELARDLLAMSPDEYAVAFKGSAMKRAKLRGLKRNAAVALGNVGTDEDLPILAAAVTDGEALVRSHAAWALDQIRARNRRER